MPVPPSLVVRWHRMALTPNALIESRPYAFHLTARSNLAQLRGSRTLHPAFKLFQFAGRSDLARSRRRTSVVLNGGPRSVQVRGQGPLHKGSIAFEDGWELDDLVGHVNQHVFFWPGTDSGPIREGQNHFHRYRHEQPVFLRIPTIDLLQANLSLPPLLCKYNSGAPRCSRGNRSPRGRNVYTPVHAFSGGVARVKELVFCGTIVFPERVEIGSGPKGPWSNL